MDYFVTLKHENTRERVYAFLRLAVALLVLGYWLTPDACAAAEPARFDDPLIYTSTGY